MFLQFMKIALLVVMLLCFCLVVWWFKKNRQANHAGIRKGGRVRGIMRVILTAVKWLVVVWVCQIFLYIVGGVVLSNMDRYMPGDPPKWEELSISKRFPFLNEVKVLKGGDPGNHRFNQKVFDYLIYIAAPSDAAAFRHNAGETMGWDEVSGDTISAHLPYMEGYEHYFAVCKETGFAWKNGKTEYDFSIYEGQEGYFYIRVMVKHY